MENLNYEFLETYKKLDKLCREIFTGDETGVTAYINEMRRKSFEGKSLISNWDFDLKKLTSLRHFRNSLTHDVGTLETTICTEEDIEFLESLRQRILSGSDPLALLEQAKNPPPPVEDSYDFVPQKNFYYTRSHSHKPFFSFSSLVFSLIIILLFVAVLWIINSFIESGAQSASCSMFSEKASSFLSILFR